VLGCHRSSQGDNDCGMSDFMLVQSLAPVITQTDDSRDACLASVFTARRVAGSVDCPALQQMRRALFAR